MQLESPPIKVLAVEDDPLYADLIRHLLRRDRVASYELRWAKSLAEALVVVESEVIDVVLADLHLPDSAGMDTVSRLLERGGDVPVVVLTGVDDDQVGSEAVRRGAQDYLVKQEVRGGILGRVLRDAIERKAAESREQRRVGDLEAAYAELERTQGMLLESERISAIGQMASGLVQEVKNPLTLVSQMIDYLDRAVLGSEAIPRADSEIARRLDAMREAVARADAIIQELVEFSQPDRPRLERTDIEKVVRRAAEFATSQRNGSPVDVRIESELPGLSVVTDRRKLSQVVLNLLMNAIQASESGSSVGVRLQYMRNPQATDDPHTVRSGPALAQGSTAVVCDVVDEGRGIPRDLLPRVFDPFFTTKPAGEGVGLGLAVSRRMIEQLGGYVEISSRLGSGTRARVVLPAVGVS
ncbi:MAG TPA: ATP-binding protein [Candidatus Binatia bacterium]|nr:ATP-binding protein [Candidatus Binatia bacterium]